MKITRIEYRCVDGGWRPFWFLKITTDDGLIGWSEYTESPRNRGLTEVIRNISEWVIGEDPREFSRISASLYARTRLASGGMTQQAISAIENACIDIAAKAANVPVYALFGGPIRKEVLVYWSHCGNFRITNAAYFERVLKTAPLRSLDDVKLLGQEVAAKGYLAAKTSPVFFRPNGKVESINPGFRPDTLDYGGNAENNVIAAIADQLAAFREGLGPDRHLLMDLNFSFRPEAIARTARAAEPMNLTFLETDSDDPLALARVRASTNTPIASCETLYGRRAYKPWLDAYATDVVVIDALWNGLVESVKIANMAESYGVNYAPHSANGPLADLIGAHFCAIAPNLRILELEVDDVPWKYEVLTVAPVIKDGHLIVPTGVGWGADLDEEVMAAHGWKGGPAAPENAVLATA